MRRSMKFVLARILPRPEGSSPPLTSPASPPAAGPAWLRRVFAVPTGVAMLTLALVTVMPQFSSPVSAQTSSCAAPVTAAPTGPAIVSTAPSAFGRVLVVGSGENSGCALYVLTSDQLHSLTSGTAPFACTDVTTNLLATSCDTVLWPALLTDGAPIAGRGVNPRALGTVTRTDVLSGTSVQQVTYGGLPLYQFFFDKAPGQTTGANLFDPVTSPPGAWYLVEPSRGRPAPGQALIEEETAPVFQNGSSTGTSATVLAASESTGLSEIGDGPVSVPVYTFSLDRGHQRFGLDSGHQSACQATCAVFWSPVLTSMFPEAGAGVDRHQLGVIVRPDGTLQVTFDGHPLYMFVKDAYLPLIGQTPSINGAGVNAFGGVFETVPPT
jgi:predicted lipoprotein with Yx(FWY)xxD motif